MRALSCLAFVLFVGCQACHHADANTPPETPPRGVTCTVPGLESAHTVPPITLPTGCAFTSDGTFEHPRVARTAEEVTAALRCDEGVAHGIDVTVNDLYVVTYSLSPAGMGTETLDDGTTLSFLSRFRHNCPDDPMPMPMNVTFGFLIPKGAERAVRTMSCTLPEDC